MNMLEAIDRGDPAAERWRYAQQWADRHARVGGPRRPASSSIRPPIGPAPLALFDVAAEHSSRSWRPGSTSSASARSTRRVEQRLELLRSWLVDEPRGWDESGVVGSVRYTEADLAAFSDPDVPVLMFVGRFTEQKRLPLLLRAYGRARRESGCARRCWSGVGSRSSGKASIRSSVVRHEGIEGVFFTGWHGHEELPDRAGLRRRLRLAFGG